MPPTPLLTCRLPFVGYRLVTLALVALLASCTKSTATAEAPAAKVPTGDVVLAAEALAAADLKYATASKMPRRTAISVVGTLAFPQADMARVGPLSTGRVVAIPVTPGQRVSRGTVLVSLESADAGMARADVVSAESRRVVAEAELAREETLKAAGATSERSLLAVRAERDRAQSDLAAARSRAQAFGGKGALSRVDLTSPMEGTVLEVSARLGQPVSAADTLVVVGNATRMWLEVDLYERDVARVHVGDEVRVRTVAYPDRLITGHVENLALTVDAARRVLPARIVLPNDGGYLRAGMSATGRILGTTTETSDAGGSDATAKGGAPIIAAPQLAIQRIDGQPFVFVARPEGESKEALFRLVAVELGAEVDGAEATDERFVEIRRGLLGGERIVTDGSFVLKSEALKSQMGSND